MPSDSVVTYLFPGPRDYAPEHVNVLQRAVARHLSRPHRFICVTDGFERSRFSADVEVYETPPAAMAVGRLPSPEGERWPSSYRRLWTLSTAALRLGERVLVLDIDCVPVDDLDPLFGFDADFVGWTTDGTWQRDARERGQRMIGGGTWLARPGAHDALWRRFEADPRRMIGAARAKGFRGSDQAILSDQLGQTCEIFPAELGIVCAETARRYGIVTLARTAKPGDAPHRRPRGRRRRAPAVIPPGGRLIHFNGYVKPWHALEVDWIREHWQ